MMGVGSYGYPASVVKTSTGAGGGYDVPEGVELRGRYDEEYAKILSKEALQFVVDLQREFRNRIKYALECRREAKRRVEITGPVERKMVINALNSGAKVFMADFEDALSPSWENLIRGQVNLKDAVDGSISFHDKAKEQSV
ncbi:hypothetical protein M0R45_023905 [Rubus argutus]|uniref:Malate synthase N-terminal domain-containing protein n=1 Tax=Rubus argutus TaxID=59490 RepID=A0AAW1WP38_RUBAR